MKRNNFIPLSKQALAIAVKKTQRQDDAILLMYLHRRLPFAPSQVWRSCQRAKHNWPLSAVKRVISRLCKAGHLVKTDQTSTGIYGRRESKWIINERRHPDPLAVQQTELF